MEGAVSSRKQIAHHWGNMLGRELTQTYEIGVHAPIRFVMAPRLVVYIVRLRDTRSLDKVLKLGEKTAMLMGAESCRISRQRGDVTFEVSLPRAEWKYVNYSHIKDRAKGGMWLTLGVSTTGMPVYCKVTSPRIAPILVAGRTGAGKTEVLRLSVSELLENNSPDKLKMVMYDPKHKLEEFHRSPHMLMPPLADGQETLQGLAWLVYQMNGRMASRDFPYRIVVVVDELLKMMGIDEKAVGAALGELASVGRECGIHMILATQRPDRAHMGAIGKANIGFRLVGETSSTVEATLAAGMGGTGANLLQGRGDFLGVLDDTTIRFQSAMIQDVIPYTGDLALMPKTSGSLAEALSTKSQLQYSPEHVAAAMTMGIIKLKSHLGIGQDRATKIRRYATDIIDELKGLGYTLE